MSVKVCDHHGSKRKRFLKRFCIGLLIFNFILLIVILLIFAILRPQKPKFILQDATVYAFNVSSPPDILTSNIQITVSSRNPNDNIGIYYDRLEAYATYKSQQITLRTGLPTGYQGHKEVDIWSPFVSGNAVPVAPYNAVSLSQDQSNGAVLVLIKIDGRVRWKVGTFISGRYHLYVRCPAYITFGNRNTGVSVGSGVKYQLVQSPTNHSAVAHYRKKVTEAAYEFFKRYVGEIEKILVSRCFRREGSSQPHDSIGGGHFQLIPD